MFLLTLFWGLRLLLQKRGEYHFQNFDVNGSNTVHKASNSTADESNMQCEESGVKEKFEKNAEIRVDSFRDLRCVHQQLISHHCTTLIKAPSPLVKRQQIETMKNRFGNLPDELQIDISLKVAVLHQKAVLPSNANLEIGLCLRKLLQAFIQQRKEVKRTETDVADNIREILRRITANESEEKLETKIQILNEELLLHRANNRRLDETLKTNISQLDNETQKSRGLETQVNKLQNESEVLLKQRDYFKRELDNARMLLHENEMVSEQKQSSTRELEHEMNEREHLTDDTQVLQKEYSECREDNSNLEDTLLMVRTDKECLNEPKEENIKFCEEDTSEWILYRRHSGDIEVAKSWRHKEWTSVPEKIKLRAIRDFDPEQMNRKEEIELAKYMQKIKLDTSHVDLQTIYRSDEQYRSKVALTFKRGETMETIPPSNIGDNYRWLIVERSMGGKKGLIPRNHVVIEKENDHRLPGKQLNDIPLELLDNVLEHSLLHCILHDSPRRNNKEAITALASVDFCWFQRTTRPRFKKRIFKRLKDLYDTTRRKSSIIRNNRNYLLENIRPNEELIALLLSLNCITEDESRKIRRHHSIRNMNTEIVYLMKSFDETKTSDFLKCLRENNQKTVARVIENGGGVIKVEIKNHVEEFNINLLHEKIENLQKTPKSWSHKICKVITRMKEKGLEILNSRLDGHTVVVWIWCRSQGALQNIQKMYESNQLTEIFFDFINIGPPDCEVSKSKLINIYSTQLKKNVAVSPISIGFRERLDVGRIDHVYGVTKLQNKIYVLCRSPSYSANGIIVFENLSPFHIHKRIEIGTIKNPGNIGSSEKENCLYVCEPSEKCVWKIPQEADEQGNITKWLTTDYEPSALSVSSDGQVLVVSEPSSILMIFGPEAELSRSIQLPTDMKSPRHVVESSIGNFIILHRWIDERRSNESIWAVSELATDGQMVVSRFIPSNKKEELDSPYLLSLDSENRVFVADGWKDRVVLLDVDLQWNRVLCQTKESEGEEEEKGGMTSLAVVKPWPIYYDERNRLLVVGGYFDLRFAVNIYNLSRL